MIHFLLLVSRQGKVRLNKWYSTYSQKEKTKIQREVTNMVLNRPPKLCNFIEWKEQKIIYKRYASLYFLVCVDPSDNELVTLEVIHHFVEVLDRYFGNVCELDLIFNFHKLRILSSSLRELSNEIIIQMQAYFILDEMLMAGELQETSKKNVLRILSQADVMNDTTGPENKGEL